jgi:glycosidase
MKKQSLRCICAALLVAMLLMLAACQTPADTTSGPVNTPDPVNDNYRTFYQIFVGSFSDSNGDGFGDLRGIINRFDYLNDGNMNSETSLGVQGIWLSPIFSSPSYHKYDAKSYYKVDWRFGTEEDLKELSELCHSRNVKLILDLAINHTSTQHEWFLKFKQARIDGDTENPYYNFYTCATTSEREKGRTYHRLGSTDWWYEGNFSNEMPELDYDNPDVRQAVLDVAKYYLEMGIDGFRFDAVKYIYYNDNPRSIEFWQWYMEELKKINPDVYCVGECWSGDGDVLQYYKALNCFNFTTSSNEGVFASTAKGNDIGSLTGYVSSYQDRVLEANSDGMPMFFLANHDQDRIAGTFLFDSQRMMVANLYLLAPGSPVIYYGEEIGMKGSRGAAMTDANRRLAMLWGDDDVRNPVGSTYPADKQVKANVLQQLEDENSLLRHYCRLLTIRHTYPAIARGDYEKADCGSQELGGFVITYEGQQWILLHNVGDEEMTIDLSTCSLKADTLLEAIGAGSATLKGSTLTIAGKTSVLLK